MASGDLDSLNKIPCPSCGHLNAPGRLTCESCGTNLLKTPSYAAAMPGARPGRVTPKERPGCVTVYAVLLGIGGAATSLQGIGLFAEEVGLSESLTCGISLLFSAFYFSMAYGLWNLKNWGRILVIVSRSLQIAVQLCAWVALIAMAMVYSLGNGHDASIGLEVWLIITLFALVGLAVNIVIIWWFASHKEYFN
jgi:hypothetical protein